MKSLNRIEVIGNVGGDPVVRHVHGKVVAEFSVATSEKWATGERTDWHRVTAWGKLAEIIEQYVRKGDKLFIAGSMRYETYTDKQGVEKQSAKINAQEMLMLGSRQGSRDEVAPMTEKKPVPALHEPNDDLPF